MTITIKKSGLLALVLGSVIILSTCQSSQEKGIPSNKNNSKIADLISAVSVDSIESHVKKLVGFHTRHTTSVTTNDSIGIGAARRWIRGKFEEYREQSGDRLKVKLDSYIEDDHPRIQEPTEIVNVLAVLPGTQLESKDRTYVVSAHYDSRVSDIMDDTSYAPGANDDASGTAAVLELARVMSKHEFDATIVFMAVAGEEQGLLGASHYAEKAKQRNKNIAAMITNDIIGNTIKNTDSSVHDDEIRVFAQGIPANKKLTRYQRQLLYTGGENDTPSRQLGRFVHDISTKYFQDFNVNLIYRLDRYLRGGDHSAFLEEGYPAVRFSEPHEYFARQHEDVRMEDGVQYGDLPRFVDYDYVGKVTKLNAAVLATLASAPEPPKNVGILVSKLTNNTTLQWKANGEPDIKQYEIVWRPTHEHLWQYSKLVGDTTQYTIKGVSKDNFIFGVRAVDKYGYKSPAVYPMPVR